MIIAGLTGGIGSGKSTVRRFFAELGARTADADEISRELVVPGSDALSEIVDRFGSSCLLPDGRLDRRHMAETVFTDPEARHDLERILHPRIGRAIDDFIAQCAEENPGAVVVVEVALLYEVGLEENFDRVVLAYADESTRIERLMRRDGLARNEAYTRLLAQLPLESKLNPADFVIDTGGSWEATRQRTAAIYNALEEYERLMPGG